MLDFPLPSLGHHRFEHLPHGTNLRRQAVRHGGRVAIQRRMFAAVIVVYEEHAERGTVVI
jgi:hypothetical protein